MYVFYEVSISFNKLYDKKELKWIKIIWSMHSKLTILVDLCVNKLIVI